MRQAGDWVQIVSFNASRFDEAYIPRSSFEFLKMPGDPTGPFLVQELQVRPKVQRWITIKEHAEHVERLFFEMVAQFRPALDKPLREDDVIRELERQKDYWPHAYALAVIAAEKGEAKSSRRYFELFQELNEGKQYRWVQQRTQELEECLRLIGNPVALRSHLDAVAATKLRALGLSR
jgi:hypothetical protein